MKTPLARLVIYGLINTFVFAPYAVLAESHEELISRFKTAREVAPETAKEALNLVIVDKEKEIETVGKAIADIQQSLDRVKANADRTYYTVPIAALATVVGAIVVRQGPKSITANRVMKTLLAEARRMEVAIRNMVPGQTMSNARNLERRVVTANMATEKAIEALGIATAAVGIGGVTSETIQLQLSQNEIKNLKTKLTETQKNLDEMKAYVENLKKVVGKSEVENTK